MYDFFDERKCFLNIKVGHIVKLIFYLFSIGSLSSSGHGEK